MDECLRPLFPNWSNKNWKADRQVSDGQIGGAWGLSNPPARSDD